MKQYHQLNVETRKIDLLEFDHEPTPEEIRGALQDSRDKNYGYINVHDYRIVHHTIESRE